MSKRPDASVRVRCCECKKIFVVNLVKAEDMPDGKKVKKIQPCAYCGEDNSIIIPEGMAQRSELFRTVREVVEGMRSERMKGEE